MHLENYRTEKGFSLTELMIVVAIIGILAAIAIPGYLGIQKRAERSEFKTNLEILRMAEEKRYAEFGAYVAGADSDALVSSLSDFRPGDTTKLKYEYRVVVTGAQSFTAYATGRSGSADAGKVFTVDQDNNRTGW